MCRNIKPLFNFDPPPTDEEIRAAAVQFVRKVSGFQKPSEVNEKVFNKAVDEVSVTMRTLMDSLVTTAKPKNREEDAEKARKKSIKRFGNSK